MTVRDLELLEGEDPQSREPEDALHWSSIYAELAKFHETLIERLAANGEGLDSKKLARLRERHRLLSNRRDFWSARHWELAGLQMDATQLCLLTGKARIELTRREFDLLEFLTRNPGRYYPARRLVVEAWHDGGLSEEQLRVYVARLRTKLRKLGSGPTLVSRRGRGYALLT